MPQALITIVYPNLIRVPADGLTGQPFTIPILILKTIGTWFHSPKGFSY